MAELAVEIPSAMRGLFKPKRMKVFYGGRGGGKSYSIALVLVLLGYQKQMRILCARELQKSILDSVHRLLCDTIDRLGLGYHYEITKTGIRGANGTEFLFSGVASNVTAIKSMEGIDICWLEEAESVSDSSWDVLIPTFRKKGSEIWVSFNPFDEFDPTFQKFISPYLDQLDKERQYEDDRILVKKITYSDNPYFKNTELHQDMMDDKENNYNKYLHIWEGNPHGNYEDSVIKPEWVNAAVDAHKVLGFKPKGTKAVGYDPADEGNDDQALTHIHGSVVVESLDKADGDITDGINWAFNYAEDINATHLVYDGIGVGAAVKERLRSHSPSGRIHTVHQVVSSLRHSSAHNYRISLKRNMRMIVRIVMYFVTNALSIIGHCVTDFSRLIVQ